MSTCWVAELKVVPAGACIIQICFRFHALHQNKVSSIIGSFADQKHFDSQCCIQASSSPTILNKRHMFAQMQTSKHIMMHHWVYLSQLLQLFHL